MPGGPLLGNRLARSCVFKARFRARWRVGASRIPLLRVLPPSLDFVVRHSFQSNPTGERSPKRVAPRGMGLASATAGTAQESRGRKASPARNAMDSCRGRLAPCQQAGPAPRGARIMHGETGRGMAGRHPVPRRDPACFRRVRRRLRMGWLRPSQQLPRRNATDPLPFDWRA